MEKIRLGNTGLYVSKDSFGCLPLQRMEKAEAVKLLRRAMDTGVNFYDTARVYTDSEEKIGEAFHGVRQEVLIATKTMSKNREGVKTDLAESLKQLKTDYIDLYQLHNPGFIPVPGGDDGIYDFLVDARQKGIIRYFGITNHALDIAEKAVYSGLYDTLQFPFSCLSSEKDEQLAALCKEKNVGFIAMKALSGGLIRNIEANYAYIHRFANVVPIWGIQKESEFEEFEAFIENPPVWNEKMQQAVLKEKEELSGEFCRGCGYCLPCPAGINIPIAARIKSFMRRAVLDGFMAQEVEKAKISIPNCTLCRTCETKCPYHLKPYELIQKQL